jgi:gas vesicle protein
MMQNNGTGSIKAISLMFVGGAALGAVAGLLFAPKSGKDTRREIKVYATRAKRDVVKAAQRTKAGIEAALEKGRRTLVSVSKVA